MLYLPLLQITNDPPNYMSIHQVWPVRRLHITPIFFFLMRKHKEKNQQLRMTTTKRTKQQQGEQTTTAMHNHPSR